MPGEVSGTKKHNNFLEKNPVKTVENYSFYSPSVAYSVAAFNQFVRPLERAQGTLSKYVTHRLSVLTWAIWKGCLPHLLPMTDDLLRAFLWDCLAFEASVSVLKHAVDAVKGWHRRLGMPVPMDGPGAYRRVINSLCRFQPVPRILKFPIHQFAVRRLLTSLMGPVLSLSLSLSLCHRISRTA